MNGKIFTLLINTHLENNLKSLKCIYWLKVSQMMHFNVTLILTKLSSGSTVLCPDPTVRRRPTSAWRQITTRWMLPTRWDWRREIVGVAYEPVQVMSTHQVWMLVMLSKEPLMPDIARRLYCGLYVTCLTMVLLSFTDWHHLNWREWGLKINICINKKRLGVCVCVSWCGFIYSGDM